MLPSNDYDGAAKLEDALNGYALRSELPRLTNCIQQAASFMLRISKLETAKHAKRAYTRVFNLSRIRSLCSLVAKSQTVPKSLSRYNCIRGVVSPTKQRLKSRRTTNGDALSQARKQCFFVRISYHSTVGLSRTAGGLKPRHAFQVAHGAPPFVGTRYAPKSGTPCATLPLFQTHAAHFRLSFPAHHRTGTGHRNLDGIAG